MHSQHIVWFIIENNILYGPNYWHFPLQRHKSYARTISIGLNTRQTETKDVIHMVNLTTKPLYLEVTQSRLPQYPLCESNPHLHSCRWSKTPLSTMLSIPYQSWHYFQSPLLFSFLCLQHSSLYFPNFHIRQNFLDGKGIFQRPTKRLKKTISHILH